MVAMDIPINSEDIGKTVRPSTLDKMGRQGIRWNEALGAKCFCQKQSVSPTPIVAMLATEKYHSETLGLSDTIRGFPFCFVSDYGRSLTKDIADMNLVRYVTAPSDHRPDSALGHNCHQIT